MTRGANGGAAGVARRARRGRRLGATRAERGAPAAVAALALCLAAGGARADEADVLGRAKELFNAGARAYDAGQFEAAARALEEAYRLAPRPAILFSMAQAERQHYTVSHDPAFLHRATLHYRQYVDQAPQGARRADAARSLTELELLAARASEIVPRAPPKASTRVLVTSPAPAAAVSLDGGRSGKAPLVEEVSPGRHVVRVEAAGHQAEERTILAAEGGLVALDVPLRELPARVAFAGAPPGAHVTVDGRAVGVAPLTPVQVAAGRHAVAVTKPGWQPFSSDVVLARGETTWVRVETAPTPLRTTSYVLGAASAAALVAGGAFTGLALHYEARAGKIYYDERGRRALTEGDGLAYADAREARDDWRSRGALAFGAGAAFAIGAVTVYVLDGSTAPPPARAVEAPARAPGRPADELSLRPFLAPGLGGAALRGTF